MFLTTGAQRNFKERIWISKLKTSFPHDMHEDEGQAQEEKGSQRAGREEQGAV